MEFLILVFKCSLFVYRNAVYFCVLILYAALYIEYLVNLRC